VPCGEGVYAEGAPMRVQQELMRHASIQTTMNVYGQGDGVFKARGQQQGRGDGAQANQRERLNSIFLMGVSGSESIGAANRQVVDLIGCGAWI
jgi:hypothetical protein